ncbi:MAG: hypothetical protein QM783_15950 [Phycisphaerales bacterium]
MTEPDEPFAARPAPLPAARTAPSEPTASDRWIELLYGQGSECCRNYSKLTMQVRTLAAGILAASAFGVSSIIVQSIARGVGTIPQIAGPLLAVGGFVLVVFAVMLWLVNWHFSDAFRAMRDFLNSLERSRAAIVAELTEHVGVWDAHARARTRVDDEIASTGPFVALGLLGVCAMSIGAHLWLN